MAREPTRRCLLATLAVAPMATLAPAALASPSALLAAVAASRAADARFNALPGDLEETDPAQHSAEEDRMLSAFTHACEQTPASWGEFVLLFDLMTADGAFGMDEDKAGAMLKHARRLLGEAS